MIWIAPLLAWAVVGAFIVKTQPRWSRHDECLKNIGRLESELFPELPKELRWAKWPAGSWEGGGLGSSEPGAIIPIHAGGSVEWLNTKIFGDFYPCASVTTSNTKLTWQEQVMEEIAAL